MIKLFRNIRKNLLQEGKTTKYFKYAIGEIVLVVIGILIALQINTWNENRKAKTYENQVYKQIYNDVKIDSLDLQKTISNYESRDTLFNRILYNRVPSIAFDTINKENQRNSPYSIFLVTNYYRLINTTKGYQLFKTFSNSQMETDSLSFYIKDYYSSALDYENFSEILPTTTRKNMNELRSYT